uniref:(northern house mosquito) hypothetical protein n=1 Tax=Culex pipiens TaxID=7175 RepID=A0A8D8C529_CULPI
MVASGVGGHLGSLSSIRSISGSSKLRISIVPSSEDVMRVVISLAQSAIPVSASRMRSSVSFMMSSAILSASSPKLCAFVSMLFFMFSMFSSKLACLSLRGMILKSELSFPFICG